MSFGYSVGDFIAVAGLIHNVVLCLREAGGASAVYRELCADLEGLGTTLRRIQSLEQKGPAVRGLWEACGQCSDRIREFLGTIDKYQSTLKHGTPGGWVLEAKRLWHKIDWGILKEDQVRTFKASLATPLQRVHFELANLLVYQGNAVRGTQNQHSETLYRILSIVQRLEGKLQDETGRPPAYEEDLLEEGISLSLSSSPPTTKKIDNVLKELRMIGNRFENSQGNSDDIDGQVVNAIKETSTACKNLQKEAETLKWSELSKVLEMLPGILDRYDENLFRNFPAEIKKRVVHAMGGTLENSLANTDQVIALLQEHQRESDQKGRNIVGDPQQYLRVSRCITNLAHVASQFDGFVSRPDPNTKPWPYEDFESKTREPFSPGTGIGDMDTVYRVNVNFKAPNFSRTQSAASTFDIDFEALGSSIKYMEDVTPRSSYSDKAAKGCGVSVEEIWPSTNSPDLFLACQKREIGLLEKLLKASGVRINETDDKGNGVLHLSLGIGKVNKDKSKMTNILNVVRLLCTNGADVNAPGESGLRPIHYCAKTINSEAAKYLLDHGARINELDDKKRTVLNHTTLDPNPDVEFVKMLIGRGGKLGTAKLQNLPPRASDNQKKVRLLVMKR